MTEPTIEVVPVNGVELQVTHAGEGPLVLLLHGGGQTRHAWKGTGQVLANAGYFAVAYDARGHGDSGWDPEGNYAYEAMVEDLLCISRELDCDDPILVGASMGGMVSLSAVGGEYAELGLQMDAAALVLVDIPSGNRSIIEMHDHSVYGIRRLADRCVSCCRATCRTASWVCGGVGSSGWGSGGTIGPSGIGLSASWSAASSETN